MSEQERNKDKRIGWAVSASIHVLIVLLFFLINAWTAPDPPLPEYGIELNFGIEEAGSGFEQPVTQPTPPTIEEQGEPEEQVVEELEEEVVEEQPEPEPVENTTVEELPDSQQEDSPVETKPAEVPKPVAKPVEEEVKETKPVTKPVEQPPKEEPVVEEKKVDSNALYPGSSSQGNKENKAGDAGTTEGSLDSDKSSGKPGGGGDGPELSLAGWMWNSEPKPEDNSQYRGKIVFIIRVNEYGEIDLIQVEESNVPRSVLQIYQDAVEDLTFRSTTGSPKTATGKITFRIQTNK